MWIVWKQCELQLTSCIVASFRKTWLNRPTDQAGLLEWLAPLKNPALPYPYHTTIKLGVYSHGHDYYKRLWACFYYLVKSLVNIGLRFFGEGLFLNWSCLFRALLPEFKPVLLNIFTNELKVSFSAWIRLFCYLKDQSRKTTNYKLIKMHSDRIA